MKLIFDFIMVFVAAIASSAVVFYIETLIGKALLPELYGDYKVVITTVTLLGQLLLFGLDYVIVKQIPRMLYNKRMEHAKFFVINLSKVVFCILIIWEAFSILINQTVNNLIFDKFFSDVIHPAYFYLGCAGIFAAFTLLSKAVRAFGQNLSGTVIKASEPLLKLMIIMLIPITLNVAILSSIASRLLIMFIAIPIILISLRKFQTSKFPFPPNIFKDALNYTAQQLFAFRVHGILLIIMESLPLAEGKIGIFAATVTFVNLSLIITGVIQNIFQTPIIHAMASGKVALRKLLFKIYIVATVAIIFADILLYFLTPAILHLYGIHFASTLKFIPYALIVNIPVAIAVGDSMFLNYFSSKTSRILTYLTGLRAVLSIILGIGFIWFFGVYGAIAVYIITETIFTLAVMYIKHVTIAKISDAEIVMPS